MSWKARFRLVINGALEPAGLSLRRFRPELTFRAMESPDIRKQQVLRFRESLALSLKDHSTLAGGIPSEPELDSFVAALRDCPIHQDTGGGGFSAALLLWSISRALQPSVIIESGVFRGFTTWVFRQACPHAQQ